MRMIEVSESALDSIKAMAQACEADARRWRWCEKHGLPKFSMFADEHVAWVCNDATGGCHFAPTAAEAVDLAMAS